LSNLSCLFGDLKRILCILSRFRGFPATGQHVAHFRRHCRYDYRSDICEALQQWQKRHAAFA
jgi:hypothetical protein